MERDFVSVGEAEIQQLIDCNSDVLQLITFSDTEGPFTHNFSENLETLKSNRSLIKNAGETIIFEDSEFVHFRASETQSYNEEVQLTDNLILSSVDNGVRFETRMWDKEGKPIFAITNNIEITKKKEISIIIEMAYKLLMKQSSIPDTIKKADFVESYLKTLKDQLEKVQKESAEGDLLQKNRNSQALMHISLDFMTSYIKDGCRFKDFGFYKKFVQNLYQLMTNSIFEFEIDFNNMDSFILEKHYENILEVLIENHKDHKFSG